MRVGRHTFPPSGAWCLAESFTKLESWCALTCNLHHPRKKHSNPHVEAPWKIPLWQLLLFSSIGSLCRPESWSIAAYWLLLTWMNVAPSFSQNSPFSLLTVPQSASPGQRCIWTIFYITAKENIRRNRKVKSKSMNEYGNMGMWLCMGILCALPFPFSVVCLLSLPNFGDCSHGKLITALLLKDQMMLPHPTYCHWIFMQKWRGNTY